MELSTNTLTKLAERFDWQYCAEYGEPGYGDSHTTAVVLGDYWVERRPELIHFERRWPRVARQLEDQGVELEWYDEWTIDYEADKAYRTSADHYGWTTSVVFDDYGELITADSDIETRVEWAMNNPDRALTRTLATPAEIESAGFRPLEDDRETGWHPGQDDDPAEVLAELRPDNDALGPLADGPDVLFYVKSVGQFDAQWTTYVRS